MSKGSAAATNVVDLEAFRQRKMQKEGSPAAEARTEATAPMLVPVWFCWVPYFPGMTGWG